MPSNLETWRDARGIVPNSSGRKAAELIREGRDGPMRQGWECPKCGRTYAP